MVEGQRPRDRFSDAYYRLWPTQVAIFNHRMALYLITPGVILGGLITRTYGLVALGAVFGVVNLALLLHARARAARAATGSH
ncbi:MAG: hypothetical protein JWN46_2924 [Acidimicrobiales bacterium]|nr:hypothetical protein [Acidimicrobiales bacterium]